ncbi:MAG: hypothetical protein J6A59_11740, partial [Lachnospiraceae bacterium]|nr:hypothetical protein [Lachnospiraceae bacterium]
IQCPDTTIERPSMYYMPDAVYSVAYDITVLMGQRYNYNRNGIQIYFNSLQENVKQKIVFYEAVLLYTGVNTETVDKFYQAYEKLLYDKNSNENVVETNHDGNIVIKSKFKDILVGIGITDDIHLKHLALLLSFDDSLAINDNVENIKDTYVVPYRLNYTSRENMMVAAMSLAGKVRYVWGGGHSGASFIDGINPMWVQWEALYPENPTTIIENDDGTVSEIATEGFDTCIKPSGSWCPIHGESTAEFHGEAIHSLDEYIALRANTFEDSELLSEKYRNMLSKVDYTEGINVHTLDGLDCSGYASWLYNQITSNYEFNSVAKNFPKQSGMKELQMGDSLLPGDTFAWSAHIVIIVGKVHDGSKAYVTIEQTTNLVKFGVVYYEGASSSDIVEATEIARQANELIGGLDDSEEVHVYCMNTIGDETVESTIVTEEKEYRTEEVWFPHVAVDEDYDPYEHVPAEYDYTEQIFVSNGYKLIYYIPVSTKEVYTEVTEGTNTCTLGRFSDHFIDEDTLIQNYNKTIKDMTAQEIIQYTIMKLPMSYVTGYNRYEGDLFNKELASSNLGVDIHIIE